MLTAREQGLGAIWCGLVLLQLLGQQAARSATNVLCEHTAACGSLEDLPPLCPAGKKVEVARWVGVQMTWP